MLKSVCNSQLWNPYKQAKKVRKNNHLHVFCWGEKASQWFAFLGDNVTQVQLQKGKKKKPVGSSFCILYQCVQILFGWLHWIVLFLKNSNRLKESSLQEKKYASGKKKSRKGVKTLLIWLVIWIHFTNRFFSAQGHLLNSICWSHT